MDKPRRTASLPIAMVRTLGKAGSVDTRNWVLCPRFEASVPLSRCLSCDHRETLRVTPEGAQVLCHPALERASPAPSDPSPLGAVHVSDIMTRDLLCIAAGLSIDEALHLLVAAGAESAPVVNREVRVVGIVSATSLQDYLRRAGGSDSSSIGQTGLEPVSQAMTTTFVVVAESSSALRAAAVMAHERVHQLLVSSASGEVVGSLDALAVLAWIARADGFLLATGADRSPPDS